MTSDSGVAKQYSDYARQIQETLEALQHNPIVRVIPSRWAHVPARVGIPRSIQAPRC